MYRDNLYFDAAYIEAFLEEAQTAQDGQPGSLFARRPRLPRACLAALHFLHRRRATCTWLICGISPKGSRKAAISTACRMLSRCRSTCSRRKPVITMCPTYMAFEQGDLTFQVPRRSLMAIDSWVHIFIADVVFGLFCRGARFEDRLENRAALQAGHPGASHVSKASRCWNARSW